MAKKQQLNSAEIDALSYEDAVLFHDGRGRPIDLPAATAPLADTHGHLTHFRRHDPSEALARASLAGVALLGVPVDPVDDAREPLALLDALSGWVDGASAYIERLRAAGVCVSAKAWGGRADALLGGVYLWAGVHPYGAATLNASPEAREALLRLLADPRCVGIGEFGLDFGPYNRCDPAEQERAFVWQLRLAHERGLPVELHLRDPEPTREEPSPEPRAHLLAARILEREHVPAAGCDLHCYTANTDVMRPFVEMGCHIAFGGALSFARSEGIRQAAAACPEHLILSETDSPYMAPVPLRGQECEPAMVAFSAACLARVREEAGGSPAQTTYAALWSNARRLFGVDDVY